MTRSFLMSLFVFWLLYVRSTFPGTGFDFLLKLTRQPKNNPPLERETETEREREREKMMAESREGEVRENRVAKTKDG